MTPQNIKTKNTFRLIFMSKYIKLTNKLMIILQTNQIYPKDTKQQNNENTQNVTFRKHK